MPSHYKTAFSVYNRSERDSPEIQGLLHDAENFIIGRLSDDQDQPPLEREYDGDEDIAYSIIRTERSVSADGRIVARLEIRLWTDDSDVQMSVESQVIAPDEEGDQSYRYSPPRIASSLIERYLCLDNEAQLTHKHRQQLSDSELAHLLYKSRRQLPILLISPTNADHFSTDPQRIQEQLLGLAHVAIVDRAKHSTLGPSVYCFNGASRLIWPTPSLNYSGPSPKSTFYSPRQSSSRDFPTKLRHALLTEPPHFSFFEVAFLQIRSNCVLLRNLKLERTLQDVTTASPGPVASPNQDDLKTLRRQLRKSDRQSKSLQSDNSRLQDEINRMQTKITNLSGRLAGGSTAEPFLDDLELTRRLQANLAETRLETSKKDAEIKRLQKEVAALNSNFKDLKISNEELRSQPPNQDFMGKIAPSLKLLTSLNHALNIARDPIRKYIVQNLRRAYEGNLFERFQHSINLEHMNCARIRDHPESAIDYGEFPNLVRHNPAAFENADYLFGLLEKIRRDRNKIIHPYYGATNITNQLARELLNNIVSIRNAIGWHDGVKAD